MKLIPLFTLAALAVSLHAQAGKGAETFSRQEVAAKLAAIAQESKVSGSSGATLGDYSSHAIKLSVRTKSGGGEIHAHFDDIFFVTQGKATLITGGTVADAKTGDDGETKGSGVRDGESRTIAGGDVVHIPAGTPHQLIIAPGDVFETIVVKVKE